MVGCTGRPTWTYSNGDLSICVHDVYRVTTRRPGRGHIVAAARLQLVNKSIVEVINIAQELDAKTHYCCKMEYNRIYNHVTAVNCAIIIFHYDYIQESRNLL